jgi:predicted aspartyl protease
MSGLKLLLEIHLQIEVYLLELLLIQELQIPRSIAEELQLPVTGKSVVLTAKGPVELDECIGVIEVAGKRRAVPMLISNEVNFALIGVTTLEWLRLEVDPTTGKLKESVAYLL